MNFIEIKGYSKEELNIYSQLKKNTNNKVLLGCFCTHTSPELFSSVAHYISVNPNEILMLHSAVYNNKTPGIYTGIKLTKSKISSTVVAWKRNHCLIKFISFLCIFVVSSNCWGWEWVEECGFIITFSQYQATLHASCYKVNLYYRLIAVFLEHKHIEFHTSQALKA